MTRFAKFFILCLALFQAFHTPQALAQSVISGGGGATTVPLGVGAAATNMKFFDLSTYGGDPTGVTGSGQAFNNAEVACSAAAGGLGGATIRIPQGNWRLDQSVLLKPHCSIWADKGAYIYTTTALTDLMHGATGSSNSLQYIQIVGGVWDCGGLTTNGWTIPDFYSDTFNSFKMYNCVSNGGGGISLGNTAASAANNLTMYDYYITTSSPQVTTLIPNSSGIYTPTGASIANNFIDFGNVVGYDQGINLNVYSSRFDGNHVWVYGSQGGATAGIHLTGGSDWLSSHNEVDGPIKSGGYAFWFTGTGSYQQAFFSDGSEFLQYSVNGGSMFQLDAGTIASISNSYGHGSPNSTAGQPPYTYVNPIAGDTSHLLNQNNIFQNYTATSYVTGQVAGGWGSPNPTMRTVSGLSTLSRTASSSAVLLCSTCNAAVGDFITVYNATPATYNGTWPVTAAVTNTSITFNTYFSTTDTGSGESVSVAAPGGRYADPGAIYLDAANHELWVQQGAANLTGSWVSK